MGWGTQDGQRQPYCSSVKRSRSKTLDLTKLSGKTKGGHYAFLCG